MNKSGIIKAIEKPPITIKPVIIVIKDDPSVTRTSVVLGPILSEIRPPGN
jgi:hypothetical protein